MRQGLMLDCVSLVRGCYIVIRMVLRVCELDTRPVGVCIMLCARVHVSGVVCVGSAR